MRPFDGNAPRPRVAVVRHSPYTLDSHLRRHVFALRDAGFEVDVICDRENGYPDRERVDGVNIVRMPMAHARGSILRYVFEYAWFPLLATAALAMRSLSRRYRNVEINNMPDWLIIAAVVPKLLGANVSLVMRENMPELWAQDHNLPRDHPIVRALLFVERRCAAIANHLIAPHEMARRILIRQGIDPKKIIVVPNVPDEQLLLSRLSRSELQIPRASAPRSPGTADEARGFRLVTHGSLLERYGIQTLLEAMVKVRNRIPGLHLDIIGEGEYEEQLRALAANLQLDGAVTFHPWAPYDELAERLLLSDVGVVPMWFDFVPNKLMDYVALGIPSITTESDALRLYFDYEEVFFVESRNIDALADAILTLYQEPQLRTDLSDKGHRAYRERFAWDKTRAAYLEIYGA